ncbi:MAG TPA: phospholipid carrier-dependent glycosyltransferase, partial [Acidimicrobiia bacterium]|nr:phospholipid carrier-dependent glycosyltransferase [Acidimicrobiia bacterium]
MDVTRLRFGSSPTGGRRRSAGAAAGVAIVVATVALRLPALLASRHLSFDDGVYGASAVALRDGHLPFREVFSSQGPLFLPLVGLADLLGLRTLDAPRLLAVAAGVVLVAAVWSIVRGLGGGPAPAALAAALVATSGSVLWVTGPLTSDGPALALATVAVALALAYRRSTEARQAARLAVLTGLALGASLSIKSLLVAAAIPVGGALLRDRRHLGLAAAAAAGVGIAATVPWGVADVWDQSVVYHLEAAGSLTPGANAAKLLSTLLDRDLLLVAAAVVVGGLAA